MSSSSILALPRRVLDGAFEMFSGEYLLTRCDMPNGGKVVLLRALHITVFFFTVALLILNVADPDRVGPPQLSEIGRQVSDKVEWLGIIFGSAYAAVYARFASQWSYLADVYNSLKAAQTAGNCDEQAVAEWRAGFIEDCQELHLLRKPMFASIVHGLLNGNDEAAKRVQEAFDRFSVGGPVRRAHIARIAEEVSLRAEKEYLRPRKK